MSHELFYTSAPRGLKPGSNGFCTVGVTRGLPPSLVERLEWLSGYRPLFPAGDEQAGANPVSWAHWRVPVGQQTVSVLSRVCFSGLDHTQRSNKFAHHLVLDPQEHAAGGPAWVMQQPGVMESSWAGGEPTEYDRGRPIPTGDAPPRPCEAWAAATGDAGWAGVLGEAFLADAAKPAYLIYSPGTDVLALIAEASSLLPVAARWQVTFNTYFTDLPAGLACAWRCCVTGSAAAKEAIRLASSAGHRLINLTQPIDRAPDSPMALFARTGVMPRTIPAETRSRTGNGESGTRFRSPAADWGQPIGAAEESTVREGVAVAEPEPPFVSTHGGGPSRGGVRRKAIPWSFWVAAAIWPLLVAAASWTLLQSHRREQNVPSVSTAPSGDRASLLAEVASLRTQLHDVAARMTEAKQQAFDRGKADGIKQPPDPETWVRKTDMPASQPTLHSDAEVMALAHQIQELKSELAKASAAQAVPPPALPSTIASASVIRDEDGRILAQWVALPDGPRNADPPETTLASWPATHPTKLTIDLPTAAGPLYRFKKSGDACLVLSRSSGSGLGGELELARFTLVEDSLRLRWLADDKDAKAIAAMLQFATLHVADSTGNAIATVQFIEPERFDVSLLRRDHPFSKPKPSVGTLQLIPILRPVAWQAVAGGGSAASITFLGKSGATFNIDADAHGITTDFAANLNDALRSKARANEEVEAIKQVLPKNKKGELEIKKRSEETYKAAFAAYDQAVDKCKEPNAIWEELNRPFRGQLALRLANGVVVATIELIKEPPKPE